MRQQGRGLSAVLDNVLDMYPQCESVVDDILAGCHTDGFPKAAELTTAKAIQMWAHAPHTLPSENTSLRGELIAAACHKQGDVDSAWPRTLAAGGFYLGSDVPFASSGVFPACSKPARDSVDVLQEKVWEKVGPSWRNYPSATAQSAATLDILNKMPAGTFA